MSLIQKNLLLLLIGGFLTSLVVAQPSEADIRKQLTNAGTKAIKFTKSTGTRQWNSDIGNWEWVRGVEVIRKSDYPGIDLVVIGDVVYQYTGVGKYSYWKFRTISNQYLGIPNPTATEIKNFLSRDWQKFYGYYFQKIIKEHTEPALADDPKWFWHTPNSVEFKMKLKFDHIISYTEVETVETIWKIRLYRDDPKGEWKNFIAHRSQDASDSKISGVKKYTAEQVKDLEKQTLAFTMSEQKARQDAELLAKKVTVPVFNSADEMVRFIHGILRHGTPDQFRAVMLQILASGFFVEGSTVQLQSVQEQNLANVITAAYNNKATYKLMYCEKPSFKVENWGNSTTRKTITITGAVNNCNSQFIIDRMAVGYIEGVAQTKLVILEYGIYVRQDQDAINFVNSFSDRRKLCPND